MGHGRKIELVNQNSLPVKNINTHAENLSLAVVMLT